MKFCCENFLHTLEEEKRAAKYKSQSSYVLSAYTNKIIFYWRWNPPINTVSSLTTPGRSNIFITSSARRKETVIHFIRFLGLLFQHFFHHQILTKVINTYWIRSRNISFLWSSRFPFSFRPEQKKSRRTSFSSFTTRINIRTFLFLYEMPHDLVVAWSYWRSWMWR